MKEKRNQEKKRNQYPGWIAWGLILSVLAAAIYMGCYGLFQMNVERKTPENPLETQDTADMLVQQAYVFYHDLQQRQSAEPLSYAELYVKPREGCEWVLDKTLTDDGYVSSLVYGYLSYLEDEYFVELEDQFARQINYNFDYFCRDLATGASFSNTEQEEPDMALQYFCLTLIFDEYGNCRIGDVRLGQDATLMRKYANAAARKIGLETDEVYVNNSGEIRAGLDAYFTLGRPANCQITYAISNETWRKYESGEAQIFLNGRYYDVGVSSYLVYRKTEMKTVLLLLCAAMAVLAFFLPIKRKKAEGAPEKPVSRWLRLPPEAILVAGYVGGMTGARICFILAMNILNGTAAKSLAASLGMAPRSTKVTVLLYGFDFLMLTLLFFFLWYLGVNLRDLRSLGLWGYVKERSLIYRFFPYVRSQVEKLYETLVQFDLTKNANKMILRLVVINGLILFAGCTIWLGGWGFALVYSVLLYLFLRKYVSNLQDKYARLLRATNEIAEGNLNVQIQENLGIFEPFKPQIYRIQEGFQRAVEEEVKSQRMKAELITNVSHDLKTPLTAIITYINLLKEENITEEQRKEYLDTLERKSLRLKVLIEDLFEVSKANSQNMTLNIMDVDVMNLIRQVAFEMGDKLADRKLDLRMAFPEEKVVLKLDSQRTYRIYENLFANIAKYAMPGTRVYVNGFVVEDSVVVTMKNIAEDEICVNPEELTDRFVRGDSSRNTEGSGLGLAIAKSFTELQGGELELEIDGDLFKVTTVWRK